MAPAVRSGRGGDPSGTTRGDTMLEIKLGSNIVRDSNGVLKFQGKEQLVLEYRSGQLWLTMDFYDERGIHVAHVRRNQWVFNEGQRLALQTNPPALSSFGPNPWVTVSDRKTGEVYVEAAVMTEGRIDLVQGRFFTHRGERVEVTPHVCRIGPGVAHFGEVFECRGGSAAIG
ncbi:MAG: hypothetical protein AB7G48_19220 [Nitrospiraceae bacterium]